MKGMGETETGTFAADTTMMKIIKVMSMMKMRMTKMITADAAAVGIADQVVVPGEVLVE